MLTVGGEAQLSAHLLWSVEVDQCRLHLWESGHTTTPKATDRHDPPKPLRTLRRLPSKWIDKGAGPLASHRPRRCRPGSGRNTGTVVRSCYTIDHAAGQRSPLPRPWPLPRSCDPGRLDTWPCPRRFLHLRRCRRSPTPEVEHILSTLRRGPP